MANTKPGSSKENEKNIILIVVVVVMLIVSVALLFAFGILTKTGVLPNIFGISILSPERTSTSSSISSRSTTSCSNTRSTYGILPDCLDINPDDDPYLLKKPVIYLYPTKETNVNVKLEYKGEIFADYPKYDESIKGWNVKAYPDGKIINSDGKEYSYIFWEGNPSKVVNWDLSTGFVVKGEDTVEFLQNTLSKMGLTPKEYNEFIVYWYPKMKENKYNLIHFAGEEYTNLAKLTITPTPDSELRVFMVYKALDEKIDIGAQVIKPFERKGFSVIEWGGSELSK